MIDRLIVLACLMVALCPATAFSDVMVNEVMANEPGSFVLLEWIELYNNSDSAVSMADYILDAGGSDVVFTADLTLEPGQFFIVCRRLYGDSASPGFEDTWGDSSGVWGDTESEARMPAPLQASFSLTNRGDIVEVFLFSNRVSMFLWTSAGSDGTSWERVHPDSNAVLQCEDTSGSTPGRQNSVALNSADVVIRSVGVSLSDSIGATLLVSIENISQDTVYAMTIIARNLSGFEIFRNLIPRIEPGSRIWIESGVDYSPRYYAKLEITLVDSSNEVLDETNHVSTALGFPPVVLSEILANPIELITSEWIEVWNRSDTIINIGTWQISDSVKIVPISAGQLFLYPGEFVILTDDSVDFASSYPTSDVRVVEVEPWPTLNNSGDDIRLTDEFGFPASGLRYSEVFDNNHTWSVEYDQYPHWGRSADPGGTPGYENRITIFQDAAEVSLSFFDRQLTSGGQLQVNASAPLGHSYTLKVFDRQGRVVCTLADNADFLAESYIWDGTTDSGARLPVGLYIVYFEVPGVGSAKETVAIVR